MIVYGLDVSTKTGCVALKCNKFGDTPEPLIAKVLKAETGLVRIERAGDIAAQMLACFDEHKPDRVVIENYGFANHHTLALLVEIGTVLRYFLHQMEIPYDEVPPTSVKKFITGSGAGKGKIGKQKMAAEVKRLYGFENKSDDVIDAYSLAAYGLAKYGKLKLHDFQLASMV